MHVKMTLSRFLFIIFLLAGGTLKAQLPAGTYNVPGDYATLADAVSALNAAGIAGNVTINMAPGRAPEEVPAGGLRLGSATLNATLASNKQLTIRGNGDTLVAYANTSGTAASMKGIFYLLGTDYVTIDSLNLVENLAVNTNSNRQMHWGYVLLKLDGPVDGCNNVTIKNCTVALGEANTSVHGAAIYAGNHTVTATITTSAVTTLLTPANVSGTHSNNTFSGNRIFGTKGIMMRGYAAPAGSRHLYDQNNQFTGNYVNFGAASPVASGILLQNQQGVNIRNNQFGNISVSGAVMAASTSYAVFLDATPDGTATVTDNVFKLSHRGTADIYGIRSLFRENGNVVFDDNVFREWEFTGASGNTGYNSSMISQEAVIRRIYIRRNQVVNQTGLNKSGGLLGFIYKMPQSGYNPTQASPDTSDAVITGNVIDGLEQIGTTTGQIQFISVELNHIHLWGKTTISGNRAENITLAAGVFHGIQFAPWWTSWGNSVDYEITDNIFNGIVSNSALNNYGSTFIIGTAREGLIRGNRITNISLNNNGGSIRAISIGSNYTKYSYGSTLATPYTESNIHCYNNILNNLHVANSGTTTQAKTVGIEVMGGNTYIYNNVISNLTNEGRISGIEAVYYDFQNYPHTTDRFHPKTFIYHNTIFIGGTSGFSGIEVSGIRAHLRNDTTDIRNNIIHLNAVSGTLNKVAAIMVDYLHNRPQVGGQDTIGAPGDVPHGGLNLNNNIYYLPPGPNNFYYVEAYSQGSNNATSLLRNGFGVSGVTEDAAKNIVNDPGFNSQCSRYKAFIGNGRESATWWEQNLTPGTAAGTYLPSGSSFAKSTAATNLHVLVTTDYAGAARGTTPDIGAFQFTGSAPVNLPPAINLTQRMPVITYCTDAASVGVQITGQNGINTTTGTAPRLYYKKSSENNVFGNYPGDNNASFNGWKYVEAIGAAPNFTFNIDYSKLTSATAAGDSIMYFVIAQDNAGTPNVAVNTVTFSNGCALPSVNIDPSVGAATAVSYGYRILSLPVMTATAGQSEYCMNGTAYLKLTSLPAAAKPQWQERRGTNPFQDIPGADSIAYVSGILIASTDYRAVIKCNGVVVAESNVVSVSISAAPAPSVNTGSRCGYGSVTLSASAGATDSLLWYETATGGAPIHTGTTFTTPALHAPRDYYVATYSNLLSGLHVGSTTPTPNSYNSNTALRGLRFDALNTFRLDSVTLYLTNGSAGDLYIKLLDAGGNELQRQTIPVASMQLSTSSQHQPNKVWVGFVIPKGEGYRLVMDGPSGIIPTFWSGNPAFPAERQGVLVIREGTGPGGVTGLWNYFFDWVVSIGCESTTRTPVRAMINPAPVISITTSGDTICNGTDAVLQVTSGNSGYNYHWMPVNTGGNFIRVSPFVTTTYHVVATDNTSGVFGGCANSDSVTITVLPAPISFFTANGNSDFCAGAGQVELIAGGGAAAYQWLRNDNAIPGATQASYTASDSGSYRLVMTEGLCSDTSGEHVLNVYPLPAPVIVRNGNTLSTNLPYSSYQWYWEGQIIPGATNPTYNVISEGKYTVAVKNIHDCEGISPELPVSLGVANRHQQADVLVYPNPASDMIHFMAPAPVDVSISSMDGKMLLYQQAARSCNISLLPDGIYMIRLTTVDGQLIYTAKITKSAR